MFQIDEFNWKNPHNLAIIEPYSPQCDQFLDLTVAKDIIRALNAELQPTCPWFNLHIDYLTSFPMGSTVSMYSLFSLNSFMRPPLLLCLMHRNECVSSIEMVVRNDSVEIFSNTDARYERRGFNTLLRAVAIIISKGLSESAEQVISNAVNIISALLMIKHFNAVSREGDISKFTISPEKLDTVITDYFHQHDDGWLTTMVELNEDNIANARSIFHDIVDRVNGRRMNCETLRKGGGRGKKYTRKNIKPHKKHKKITKTTKKCK